MRPADSDTTQAAPVKTAAAPANAAPGAVSTTKARPRGATRRSLTDVALRKLDLPKRRCSLADSEVVGLRLRVTPSGHKSWVVARRIKGAAVAYLTIGTFPAVSVALAREKARRLVADMASGSDPRERRRADAKRAKTLREVFEDYLALRGARLKASTVASYRLVIETRCRSLADRRVVAISGEDLVQWHGSFASRAVADHAARTVQLLLRYASDRHGLVGPDDKVASETLRVLKLYQRPTRKDRVIRADRMVDWFKAVELAPKPVAALFYALALTGLRRDELRLATWDCVDLERGTLFLADPKNRRPVTLPLATQVIDRLQALEVSGANTHSVSPFVFRHEGDGPVGLKTLWRWIERVKSETGIDWSPHDLRRGFLTVAAAIAPGYIVKRLAHHAEDASDVTSGYVRFDIETLRPWAQAVADRLLTGSGAIVAHPARMRTT